MKIDRRSFIKRTLTTLTALAAGLRGEPAPGKKRYSGHDTTVEIDGVTFSNPSITRLPDKWGISSSAVAERIRELSASGEFILIPSDDCEVSVVRWNGEACDDFAELLASQNPARLDSFGISAGRVRARIEELATQKPGMSRRERWFQAVLDERERTTHQFGTLAQHPERWPQEMRDDCIVDVRQFMIDELESA